MDLSSQSSSEGFGFELGGVLCTDVELLEVDSGQIMVRVNRDEIQSIRLKYGTQEQNVLGQVICGSILISSAILPLGRLLFGMGMGFAMSYWLVFAPMLGVYLIVGTMRKGFFLDIETTKGDRRIIFDRKLKAEELELFLCAVEKVYGLTIYRHDAESRFSVKM